jgi:hypothetical protein
MPTFYTRRFETPPTWRARYRYLYSPGTGWPGYTPRHWVPFSSPPTTRRVTVEVFDPASTRDWTGCFEPHRKHAVSTVNVLLRAYSFPWERVYRAIAQKRSLYIRPSHSNSCSRYSIFHFNDGSICFHGNDLEKTLWNIRRFSWEPLPPSLTCPFPHNGVLNTFSQQRISTQ